MSQDPKGRHPRIESSLGRVQIGSPTGERQPFITVDDPTDPVPEDYSQTVQDFKKEIREEARRDARLDARMELSREERAAQVQAQAEARMRAEEVHRLRKEERMESGAKRRIEILANLGRGVKDVEIDGVVFSLQTLKDREWRDAISAVAEYTLATEQAYELRGQTLARSIYAIDGQMPALVLGTNDKSEQAALIKEMDEAVVSHLYDKYNELVKENKKRFRLETAEGAQEVAEEIKK